MFPKLQCCTALLYIRLNDVILLCDCLKISEQATESL